MPIFVAIICYISELVLFFKFDRKSLYIGIPLSLYALLFGLCGEYLIAYFIKNSSFPPFWVIALYPLFALTLNSALSFLNRSFVLSFIFGGLVGNFLYFNSFSTLYPPSYPVHYISWGITTCLLILLNRKLIRITDKYTNPCEIKKMLTVFFDQSCPFCSYEMEVLKNRNQTGEVNYTCPASQYELNEITDAFSYAEAMKTIHAIDSNNNVLTGTETISALFARTDLPGIAIFLQAPGFSYIFDLCYALFSKYRKKLPL